MGEIQFPTQIKEVAVLSAKIAPKPIPKQKPSEKPKRITEEYHPTKPK